MNDRFKFRFWDKETQTMQKIPMVELRHRITLDKIFADDRVIFMQCTGLKDKNGKLIYEGDIVKTETQAGKIINYGIIGFDKEKASFLMTANLQSRDYQYSFWYLDSLEVIGNIYENKELLESEG